VGGAWARRWQCLEYTTGGPLIGARAFVAQKELLPTAFRYDPADSLVTNAFVVGMAVMAASLVLFVAL